MERPLTILPEDLQQVRDLYERGLYLQAYQLSQRFGPLAQWQGTAARVMAARLLSHLGAVRLSNWITRSAWKDDRTDAEATYYFAYRIYGSRGPYGAWKWMSQHMDVVANSSKDIRASWYALVGDVLAALRDFDAAEQWLARAEQTDPGNAWVDVSRARILEMQDRYEEALQFAKRSLAVRPWYRPAVQAAGHLLTLLDRDGDALQLFTDSLERLESGAVAAQLFALQLELQQYAAASRSLDRVEQLWPLLEKQGQQWLAAQRAELAYHLGDMDGAIEYAEKSKNEFFKQIAENLKQPQRADATVVSLPVGFVRQHHVTCGPATLAAISRYWSMPVDHLQLAEEICYDGTPAHSERRWAEQNGWYVREFTVTEPSAAQLIQQGVPFTLTTVEPSNSHLQAVIGYDGRRGVLVIRDPYFRTASEAIADKTLERYRAYGPRGMALVPLAERGRLDQVELPDAPLWDALYRLDAALVAHRRDEAQSVFEEMQRDFPQHRFTIEARRRLAAYDNNLQERVAAVEQLLERFPDNQCLLLERTGLVRDVAHRDERLKQLQDLCRRKDAHPLFWQQYAQELRMDARHHDEALWLLRRAIRRWPSHAANYYILANIFWDRRRFEEALELYRFAACLDDKDEQFMRAYFIAAKWFKRTEEALKWLYSRFDRFGRKSSYPARTLFFALCQLDRTTEALAVLEKAIQLRPDDGQVQLFAADGYLSCGLQYLPRARELVENARHRAPRGEWLRIAARIAAADGRLTEALALWRQVLTLEPLSIDAHRAVAQLLAETTGRAATLEHLASYAQLFPYFVPLHELWIEWTRDEPADVREPVIRWALERNPDNAWVHRELAFLLADMRCNEQAWREADESGRIDPDNVIQRVLRARLLRAEQRLAEAKRELCEAIKLSVDYDYAITELMDLCDSLAERREALAFVKEQLIHQVIFGDGLLTFREHARGVLDPDELLQVLNEGLKSRPDLWHAWSATVQQLLSMDRIDEAWELACQATERFPLLPRLWVDRAYVCRVREDWAGAQQALETAYQINPSWGYGTRLLCDLHERNGNLPEARRLMELAVIRTPLDSWNHVALADILWRVGEREAAVNQMYQAVQIEPGNDGAWERLHRWSRELGQPERSLEAVRELTRRRAGEARSWLLLAKALGENQDVDECLNALDQAIALNPRNVDAHDLRAVTLARAGRWEQARMACAPDAWPQKSPLELRGRLAWIEAELGNLDLAVQLMYEAVNEDPNYFFGWSRLCDWHQKRGESSELLKAAQQMVRISPHYEVSLGYLGEALLLNDDRAGAREAFRRAFELSPEYEFAGNSLFDIQLEDEDFVAAAETLAVLRQQNPFSPYVIARVVQLAARQRQSQQALEALEQACTTHFEPGCLISAAGEMRKANLAAEAALVLQRACGRHSEQSPVAADLPREWVLLRTSLKKWDCERQLQEWSERGLDVGEAVYALVRALVDAKQWRRLRKFVRQENQSWLRSNTWSWGAIGYGMAGARWYRRVIHWLADYQQRPDAQPWMLANLLEALWAHGREVEATAVSRCAVELASDNGKVPHYCWLALTAAFAGDTPLSKSYLSRLSEPPADEDYLFLYGLADGLNIMAAAAGTGQASDAYRRARQKILQARYGYRDFNNERARRRMYHRAVRLLTRYRGTLAARWWEIRHRWLQV